MRNKPAAAVPRTAVKPALRSACNGLLRLGALPSRAKLEELYAQGYRHWLNLSGTDLRQIYPHSPLLGRQSLYVFPDIFSPAPRLLPQQNPARISPDLYAEHSDTASQFAFMQAVQDLIHCWQQRQPVYVFCYEGRGRSPCVALTALHCAQGWSLACVSQTLQNLYPQAQLSQLSFSAAHWYQQQLAKGEIL